MPNRSRKPSRSPAICSGIPTSRCGLVSTSCGVGSYRAASASATGRRLPLTSTAKTRTPQLQLAEPVTGCLADPAELAPGGLGRDAAQDQPAAVGPVRGPTAPIISGGCGRWAGTRPGGMPADLVVLPGEGERLAGEGSLEHRRWLRPSGRSAQRARPTRSPAPLNRCRPSPVSGHRRSCASDLAPADA